VPPSPRVEIAPGIFAESVVKRAETPASEPYEVYRVSGGVFDQFELDSMASLVNLIGILSSFEGDALQTLGEEPGARDGDGDLEDDEPGDDDDVQQAFAARRASRRGKVDPGHRRAELELPAAAPAAAAHRRFSCDAGAARRARIWAAETLGDCLPDTDWSVSLLEQTVLQASELVGEAVQAGADAVLVTLEIDGRRLALTRFDEFPGGEAATGR
jgi:hypothetical protein